MARSAVTGDYRQFMDKNYFGSWDIEGDELIVTIDHAEVNSVQNDRGSENKLTVHLKDGYKPIIVNATNGDSISQAVGSKKVQDWAGHRIILYKERGKWFGKEGEAVRVRPYAPKEEIFCEECGAPIKAAYGKSPAMMKAYTEGKYGRALCAECAKAEAEKGASDGTEGA